MGERQKKPAASGFITLEEAARYLGLSKITIRRWTRDGTLPCVRVGARKDRRFRMKDLEEYVRNSADNSSKEKRPPKTVTARPKNDPIDHSDALMSLPIAPIVFRREGHR